MSVYAYLLTRYSFLILVVRCVRNESDKEASTSRRKRSGTFEEMVERVNDSEQMKIASPFPLSWRQRISRACSFHEILRYILARSQCTSKIIQNIARSKYRSSSKYLANFYGFEVNSALLVDHSFEPIRSCSRSSGNSKVIRRYDATTRVVDLTVRRTRARPHINRGARGARHREFTS